MTYKIIFITLFSLTLIFEQAYCVCRRNIEGNDYWFSTECSNNCSPDKTKNLECTCATGKKIKNFGKDSFLCTGTIAGTNTPVYTAKYTDICSKPMCCACE